jgi:hypothetical protein
MQSGWRWCKKCQGLAFSPNQPSVCPAGGGHDHNSSGNYALAVDDPSAQGQSGWRWCKKCQGLAFSLNQPSVCPAGGSHDHSSSGNYTLASPPRTHRLHLPTVPSKLEVAYDIPEIA